MDRTLKNLLAAVLLATLTACAATQRAPTTPARPATAKTPGVNLSGYPPSFRDGYADGCNAAKSGRSTRDEARFKSDPQFAQGWRDGFGICGR
ncbi:MAG: hypothetical protein H7X91_06315 [Burkholderiales bacterium]|nr:hypothetical protein [Burkholderiales bacterium]